MKARLLIVKLLFYSVFIPLYGQTYTCTVQNQNVNGTDFSFDIYMQRTDATEIFLGQSEFSLFFNEGNFTSPIVSYVSGPALAWYTLGVDIPAGFSNVVKFSVGALFFNNQSEFDARVCKPGVTAPGTLIATITIEGITNPSGTAGILWRTVEPHDSKVNTYQPSDPWPLTNITVDGTYTDPPDVPLPVELSVFKAEVQDEKVNLSWETQTEINNYGFEIQRSLVLKNKDAAVWEQIGFVDGYGNSNSIKSYAFTDNNPVGGSQYSYRLKQLDNDGTYSYSEIVEVELIPGNFELYHNYPNPFNPETNIKFSLPVESRVRIIIYNMLGEIVEQLIDGQYEAGYHKVEFNSVGYSSGIYIYRLITDNFSDTKKMVLLK